jgi:prolyl-tRNA synthetase
LASAIEQSNDKDGIIFPASISPYDIYLGYIGKTPETKAVVESLYAELKNQGYEILFDDRQLGPGQMFKDADLIGLPMRVILGERDYMATGDIEVKIRKTGETLKVKKDELNSIIKKKLEELGKWN